MILSDSRLLALRRRIPTFACEPGCHDCCGPVTASNEEMARLPDLGEARHAEALADWNCPYLGANGCEVYAERPLICRLFGTTPNLACPRGKGPEERIDPRAEQAIHDYLQRTRQVLL
ncbi:YkgJ family cysteine cluster protein [Thiocystis violacea]|uniref:YkgJ family cysteine cluster protein n=1 Tax=Thiocystis violacea TaxID=13725 RepID=UPI0019078F33|nr:YkgJ family cysteine cluster protein [Thiocystis violacea]MBK1717369.1 zinc/iron-chelating domain-containing protein [Thiocystis violacea]